MAYVPFLDIIVGLEEAYFKIVQFGSAVLSDTIRLRRSSPARSRYYLYSENSLMVRWDSLYNSFDTARKGRWTNYWATLPFGSHGGANGYPGSGFSAFIYANAPRYKNGYSLWLDPPILGTELITNGDFLTDLSGWTVFSGRAIWQAGNCISSKTFNSSALMIKQDITLVQGQRYLLVVNVYNPFGYADGLSFGFSNSKIGINPAKKSYIIYYDFTATANDVLLGFLSMGAFGQGDNNQWGMSFISLQTLAF